MKTVILTDSTCDLTQKQMAELDIEAVPLIVNLNGKSYRDNIDITKEEFYKILADSTEPPTTSQPSPEAFLEVFEKHKAAGNEIVFIGLSSVLSGTMQSAKIAKEMCGYDKIYLVDSMSAAAGLEMLIRVACRMRGEGKTAAEIADGVTVLVPRLRIFFFVDTLKYLVRGGRLSKTAGFVGGALGIKPILTVAEGSVVSIGTARGLKGGFEKLYNIIADADIETSLPMGLVYTANEENMHSFEAYIGERGVKYDWLYSEVGSVIGTHVGPGAVAVVYFVKE